MSTNDSFSVMFDAMLAYHVIFKINKCLEWKLAFYSKYPPDWEAGGETELEIAPVDYFLSM